jgi:hypothetical protein
MFDAETSAARMFRVRLGPNLAWVIVFNETPQALVPDCPNVHALRYVRRNRTYLKSFVTRRMMQA